MQETCQALIGDFIINVEKLIWNKYFIMGDCTEAKEPICVLAPGKKLNPKMGH